MRITVAFLRKHGACADQVSLFAKTFPDDAETTAENLLLAARAGLAIDWLAHFVPAPARRAYKEATAPARAAYEEAIAPAWRAYDEARATALAKHLP